MATATVTNLECTVHVLAVHREARGWTDESVAADLLEQLGLDPAGRAKNAAPIPNPDAISEDSVVALENAAKEAAEKAKQARADYKAQQEAEAAENEPAPKEQASRSTAAASGSASATRATASDDRSTR